jgi:Mrp family chromosome partitioning ATPase
VSQSRVQRTFPVGLVELESRSKSRSIVRFRSGLNTPHHPSFLHLYYALEARRTSPSLPMAVQFVSPSPGAGVSTVASGYARVAAAGRSSPVLFVDAACRPDKKPLTAAEVPTLIEAFERGIGLSEAMLPARNTENLMWSRLCDHPDDLLAIGGERLQDLFTLLGTRHQLSIFDSASIDCPEAAALSRYCDGSLLVLEAGVTSHLQMDAACKRIRQLGGQPIGIVLNRERGALSRKAVPFNQAR